MDGFNFYPLLSITWMGALLMAGLIAFIYCCLFAMRVIA